MTDTKRTHEYCVHMKDDLAEQYGGVDRNKLPDSAFVFPKEKAFPVMTSQDVKDAVSSWGRYKGSENFDTFKKNLKARAAKIGAEKSLPAKWADEGEPMEYAGFEVSDLGQLVNGKPFDGIASGDFVDMRGKPVHITAAELQQFVENTNHSIESTRQSNGEVVGLPIDMNMHDHMGGAGWIVGATYDAERNIVQFSVKWTDQGAQAIRDGLVRYFSPSLDPQNMVVMGGSLINYPATKTKDGTFLLKPIELSSMLFSVNNKPEDEEPKFGLTDLMAAISKTFGFNGSKPDNQTTRKEQDNDMPNPAELAALVETRVNTRVAELLEVEKSKIHLVELAKSWTGGTNDNPNGLPIQEPELVEFLASLNSDQQKKAETIFQKIWQNGLVEFKEKGHGGRIENGLKDLPAEISLMLDSGQMKLSELSNPVLALGDLKQYNLSKWQTNESGANVQEMAAAIAAAMQLAQKGGAK